MLGVVSAYDSSYDLNLALRYVDFAGAAYCADPIFADESISDWSCKVCAKYPGVTATPFHAVGTDANGFVAYDPAKNEIVVSFSGTDPLSIRAWIDDISTRKVDYPYCSGCQVHEGFYRTYTSVRDQILSTVKSLRLAYPSSTIAVTGHSLGAALTAHCTADLVVNGYKVQTAYAYGMPRVGNEAFEQWYVSVVPGTFRHTHGKDPVPHLPPMNWGFHHMPYEIFYTKDYTQWKMCSFEGEDETCGNQDAINLRVGKRECPLRAMCRVILLVDLLCGAHFLFRHVLGC